MKTVILCLALIALANASRRLNRAPAPENLIFVPDYIMNMEQTPMKPPQNPADNEFPKTPIVPFLPTCITGKGYFRDPYNCAKFYRCDGINAIPIAFYCQPEFIFNTNTDWCDYPENVVC